MTGRTHSLRTILSLAIAALVAGPSGVALAQDNPEDGPPPPERSLRERFDQPVVSFAFGPGSLLMMPSEKVLYQTEARSRSARANFLEQFWGNMAFGCPEGENPARDLFWQRVSKAQERFSEEALPGWISDRGRILVLMVPPESKEEVAAEIEDVPYEALLWRYPEREGLPSVVAFHRSRGSWQFTQVDPQPPEEGSTWALSFSPIGEVLPDLVRNFRREHVCAELDVEEDPTLAWRQTLYDVAGEILEGGEPEVDRLVEPGFSFFPAEGDATFVWVRFPLEEPLADGQRIVALLRPDVEGGTERLLGMEDYPFETRSVADETVAQAGRSLPPGRYAIAAAIKTAEGELETLFAGEQILVRLPADSLRLSSVVLASSIEPQPEGPTTGPFRLGGFEVVPRLDNVVEHGETLAIAYQVLGAQADESGRVDLTVTYQFHFKRPGRGWIKAGRPIRQPNLYGATQAWSTDIVPQWPEGQYKLEIRVEDNRSGGQVTAEVPFEVKEP